MFFLTHLTIALISLLVIVFSCVLFTNAVEFLGNKLKLGNNATGSILAVVGTGLPELIVPIVAIFGVNFSDIKIDMAHDIALGAILGSPFMLSTLALFLLFITAIISKKREIDIDSDFVIRHYKYFLLAYVIAFVSSFSVFNKFKIISIIFLLFLYAIFVYRTIVKSRVACVECECEGLYFSKMKINNNIALAIQLLISLAVLIFSSHCFVGEIEIFSGMLNISPIVLALLITPFATELPECINSIIWLKQGKNELAFANVLGAIVFQATLLFAIGMVLTPWIFERLLFINALLTIICAVCFLTAVSLSKKIQPSYLLFCGIVYFAYLILSFVNR